MGCNSDRQETKSSSRKCEYDFTIMQRYLMYEVINKSVHVPFWGLLAYTEIDREVLDIMKIYSWIGVQLIIPMETFLDIHTNFLNIELLGAYFSKNASSFGTMSPRSKPVMYFLSLNL